MQMYQPSGRAPLGGILLLIVLTLVGGVAAGAAVFFLSKLIYLIILFPLGMMAVATGLTALGVKPGKIRSPFVAMIFGLLAGLTIYGAYWGAQYLDFRQEVFTFIHEETGGEFSDEEVYEIIDEILVEEVGQGGFVGYVLDAANYGIDITSTRSSSSSSSAIHLEGTAVWIYWGIELLVIAGGAALLSRGFGGNPFCEECNSWYAGDKSREYLGTVPYEMAGEFKSRMQASDIRRASELLISTTDDSGLHLYAHRCSENCARDTVLVKGITISKDNKGNRNEKVDFMGMLMKMHLNDFVRQLATRSEAA